MLPFDTLQVSIAQIATERKKASAALNWKVQLIGFNDILM